MDWSVLVLDFGVRFAYAGPSGDHLPAAWRPIVTSATVEVTYEDGTTAVFDAWTWTRSALGCGDPIAPAATVVVVTP